jgi:adenylate kinase
VFLRNPFRTIIVTGIPGVGKTTVLGILLQESSKIGLRVEVANFGDYMLREAVRIGLVKDRDQLRKLPHRQQLELQKIAAKAIINDAKTKLGEKDLLIIDTHCVVKTTAGYWPGLPRHVIEELNPDSIVLIEADPELIAQRRARDVTRNRKDLGGEEEIKEMREMARAAAMAAATLTASSVYIVINPEGHPEEAAQSILALVEKL